jgi:hypothetical protein
MNNNYQPLKYTLRDMETVYKLAPTKSFQEIKEKLDSNDEGRELTAGDVAYATSVVLNLPLDKILLPGRVSNVMYAKQLARYISYYYCRQSGERISHIIGNCGHANFFSGFKRVTELLPLEWQLREHLRMILSYLKSSGFKLRYELRTIGANGANITSFKKGQPSRNPSGRKKGVENKPKYLTTIK